MYKKIVRKLNQISVDDFVKGLNGLNVATKDVKKQVGGVEKGLAKSQIAIGDLTKNIDTLAKDIKKADVKDLPKLDVDIISTIKFID